MRPLAAYLLLLLFTSLTARAGAPGVTVTDAWVRAVPGSDVAAVYLTATNGGSQPAVIIGVRSPVAASAMIHESAMNGTQSTMRAREQLPLPAGASVHFAPGGTHVMLMGLKQPLQPGDTVSLVLLLEGGGSIAVTARVRPLSEQ